jgi:putative membrane protein
MVKTKLHGVLAVVAIAALGVAACDDDDDNKNCLVDGGAGRDGGAGTTADAAAGSGGGGSAGSDAAVADGADAADAADAAVMLTDPQIAGVMVTANSGEVDAGFVADSRTRTAAVRTFANMMIADHTMANQALVTVLDAQNLLAADSPARRALQIQASQTLSDLWAAPAAGFDLAYADSQIAMHMMVLSLLDSTLIPQATNAALKTALMSARATVAAHLAEAQALRAALTADGGTTDGATDGTGGAADAADGATADATEGGGGG